MVRNVNGGTGTKSLARKKQNNQSSGKSRLPTCDLEIIACVTQMLGNGMCNITTSTGLRILGHIRNKFRGHNKRHNNITVLSFVLIGLREWETVPKNCDILYIYDEHEINAFAAIPTLKLDILHKLRLHTYNNNTNNNCNNDQDLFTFNDTDTHGNDTDIHSRIVDNNDDKKLLINETIIQFDDI
jgi:translation initiation factor IF-1